MRSEFPPLREKERFQDFLAARCKQNPAISRIVIGKQ